MQTAKTETPKIAEVRTLLKVVCEFPGKYGRVLARVRQDPSRWITGLMRIAANDRTDSAKISAKLLVDIISETREIDILLSIADLIPHETSVLTDVAVKLSEKFLLIFSESRFSHHSETAEVWRTYSERCHDAGQQELAFKCADRAVVIARGFVNERFDGPEILATCLQTLAKRLSETQKLPQAISAASEAFQIALELGKTARSNKSTQFEILAAVTLANKLVLVGNVMEAIGIARHALALASGLPSTDEFQYDKALAEMCLANHLSRMDRHEEALPHSETAERLYRGLNSTATDRFLEYSAGAAHIYAQNLLATGNLQRAFDLSICAVERMEVLNVRQPARFGYRLTTVLLGLATCAEKMGRFSEALSIGARALRSAHSLSRRLRQKQCYLEGKAQYLLSRCHYRLGHLQEALRAIRASVRAYEKLGSENRDSLMHYVEALLMLSDFTRAHDPHHLKQGVSAAQTALTILSQQPSDLSTRLCKSRCLRILSMCLERAGKTDEAMLHARECRVVCRKLLREYDGLPMDDLAFSLWHAERLAPRKARRSGR